MQSKPRPKTAAARVEKRPLEVKSDEISILNVLEITGEDDIGEIQEVL
jgi:hypothetical protein